MSVDTKRIESLFEIIDEIVDIDAPWSEKAARVKTVLQGMGSERYETSFEEFLSWFPPEGGEEPRESE